MSETVNPQDAELEEVVLGACLLESKAITLVADRLRPEVFYNEKNREIYAALQSMYRNGQNIDIITVKNELVRRGKLEFVGGALCAGVYQRTGGVQHPSGISRGHPQAEIHPP